MTIRITAACPVAMIDDANQMAMCLAFGPADGETYAGANWQDAQGNLYACASWEVRPEWITAAQSPLSRPAWDTEGLVDLAAATKAQSKLVFSLEPVLASPLSLTAVGGMSGIDAISSMGLKPSGEG